MRLSLAPLPYFWDRDKIMDFYQQVEQWPVDIVYLGETVCSKRRALRRQDWLDLANRLHTAGKEVVLSTLALIEAESELSSVKRLLEQDRFMIEANDMSAVYWCSTAQRPFVAGSSLSIYNHEALLLLQDKGMYRWVLATDQGKDLISAVSTHWPQARPLPEIEVLGWGRPPLAWSARCFSARAYQRSKDDCELCCALDPEGMPLTTRSGQAFLRINGIQVQGEAIMDLGPELPELAQHQVQIVRLVPQQHMHDIVHDFAKAISSSTALSRKGSCNGFWHGKEGLSLV